MTRPFRFGVLCEEMGTGEAWIAKARRVEELGYATLLLRDHFIAEPFGDQFAPLIALMAAAAATSTLRLGSLVLDNDYRHPVVLAKEAATLDVLSHGRFELGLGAGWAKDEYERAGIAFDPAGVRVSRLEEAVRVLKGLWAPGPLTFPGTSYNVNRLNGFPKPIQQPHPPLLIGASGKRMLAFAAREASSIGFLNGDYSTGVEIDDPLQRSSEALSQKLAWVRQAAGARFEQVELSMVIAPILTSDRRAGAEAFLRDHHWNSLRPEQVLAMPSMFIGSVDQISEQLRERRERYGFSYYIISDANLEAFAPVVAHLAGA